MSERSKFLKSGIRSGGNKRAIPYPVKRMAKPAMIFFKIEFHKNFVFKIVYLGVASESSCKKIKEGVILKGKYILEIIWQ